MSGQDNTGCCTLLAQFLDCEDVAQIVGTGASIFLGIWNTQHLGVSHDLNGFLREAFVFVNVCCVFLYFIFRNFAEQLLHQLLLLCQVKIHNEVLLSIHELALAGTQKSFHCFTCDSILQSASIEVNDN